MIVGTYAPLYGSLDQQYPFARTEVCSSSDSSSCVAAYRTLSPPNYFSFTDPYVNRSTSLVTDTFTGPPTSFFERGFIWTPQDDAYTFVDYPNTALNHPGMMSVAINSPGNLTGTYNSADLSVTHGFIRVANGRYVGFDAVGDNGGTHPVDINAQNLIVGFALPALGLPGLPQGFARGYFGAVALFQAPGAGVAPHSIGGTWFTGVNDAGTIIGHYFDNAGLAHGLHAELMPRVRSQLRRIKKTRFS